MAISFNYSSFVTHVGSGDVGMLIRQCFLHFSPAWDAILYFISLRSFSYTLGIQHLAIVFSVSCSLLSTRVSKHNYGNHKVVASDVLNKTPNIWRRIAVKHPLLPVHCAGRLQLKVLGRTSAVHVSTVLWCSAGWECMKLSWAMWRNDWTVENQKEWKCKCKSPVHV